MIPLLKFKIKGHSMFPTIRDGQTVLASSIPFLFSRPKIGDVVAFNLKDKIFVKRITKIDKENYFVKGDNVNDSKEIGWLNKKQIVGKVIWFF